MLVGDALARRWRPNDSFFLQAVGDQLVLAVSHTRLRSLVRTLAVADEKNRIAQPGRLYRLPDIGIQPGAGAQSPLSLLILEVDNGAELLRQHGDAAVERTWRSLRAFFVRRSGRQTWP